ncbi:DNA- binding [Blomia tropicalis]|nr:DNA- binding [Blomia tropicalis]
MSRSNEINVSHYHAPSSTDGPLTMKPALQLPYGWKRKIKFINSKEGKVFYVTPSGHVLCNKEEIVRYLETKNSCKCYLNLTLKFEEVFDFELDTKVQQATSKSCPSRCDDWAQSISNMMLRSQIILTLSYLASNEVKTLAKSYEVLHGEPPKDQSAYRKWSIELDWMDYRVLNDGRIIEIDTSIEQLRHLAYELSVSNQLNQTKTKLLSLAEEAKRKRSNKNYDATVINNTPIKLLIPTTIEQPSFEHLPQQSNSNNGSALQSSTSVGQMKPAITIPGMPSLVPTSISPMVSSVPISMTKTQPQMSIAVTGFTQPSTSSTNSMKFIMINNNQLNRPSLSLNSVLASSNSTFCNFNSQNIHQVQFLNSGKITAEHDSRQLISKQNTSSLIQASNVQQQNIDLPETIIIRNTKEVTVKNSIRGRNKKPYANVDQKTKFVPHPKFVVDVLEKPCLNKQEDSGLKNKSIKDMEADCKKNVCSDSSKLKIENKNQDCFQLPEINYKSPQHVQCAPFIDNETFTTMDIEKISDQTTSTNQIEEKPKKIEIKQEPDLQVDNTNTLKPEVKLSEPELKVDNVNTLKENLDQNDHMPKSNVLDKTVDSTMSSVQLEADKQQSSVYAKPDNTSLLINDEKAKVESSINYNENISQDVHLIKVDEAHIVELSQPLDEGNLGAIEQIDIAETNIDEEMVIDQMPNYSTELYLYNNDTMQPSSIEFTGEPLEVQDIATNFHEIKIDSNLDDSIFMSHSEYNDLEDEEYDEEEPKDLNDKPDLTAEQLFRKITEFDNRKNVHRNFGKVKKKKCLTIRRSPRSKSNADLIDPISHLKIVSDNSKQPLSEQNGSPTFNYFGWTDPNKEINVVSKNVDEKPNVSSGTENGSIDISQSMFDSSSNESINNELMWEKVITHNDVKQEIIENFQDNEPLKENCNSDDDNQSISVNTEICAETNESEDDKSETNSEQANIIEMVYFDETTTESEQGLNSNVKEANDSLSCSAMNEPEIEIINYLDQLKDDTESEIENSKTNSEDNSKDCDGERFEQMSPVVDHDDSSSCSSEFQQSNPSSPEYSLLGESANNSASSFLDGDGNHPNHSDSSRENTPNNNETLSVIKQRERYYKRLQRLKKELEFQGRPNTDDKSDPDEKVLSPPLPPQERVFNVGDTVWGQRGEIRNWPGKLVVYEGDTIPPETEGQVYVRWFGKFGNSETHNWVAIEDLKTLTEGLEEHHRARKRHRSGKRVNHELDDAINEAMNDLE